MKSKAKTLRTVASGNVVYLFWTRDQCAAAAQFYKNTWTVYELTEDGRPLYYGE